MFKKVTKEFVVYLLLYTFVFAAVCFIAGEDFAQEEYEVTPMVESSVIEDITILPKANVPVAGASALITTTTSKMVKDVENSAEAWVVKSPKPLAVYAATILPTAIKETKAAVKKTSSKWVVSKIKEKTMYVTASVLNLRNKPSTSSKVKKKLILGYKVTVDAVAKYKDKSQTWVRVAIEKNGEVSKYWANRDYVSEVSPLRSLGTFLITYYCPCSICCDQYAGGPTASGKMPVAGITVASDDFLEFGTNVMIDGHPYIVQDRGGMIKGNHIDIFCNTHSEALAHTMHYTEVFVIK